MPNYVGGAADWVDQYSPLTAFFGAKPDVIPWNVMGLGPEQMGALKEDIRAFPEIQALGNLYQTYMLAGLNEAIPGFSDIMKQGGTDTMTMLKEAEPLLQGQIPQDVADQVYRSTAYQSLMSGTGGSPMAHALTARDLGLTSLNLMSQGANLAGAGGNAAQLWSNIAGATIMNPQYGMVSPMERANWDLQQQLLQHNTAQAAANVAAAPNPTLSGLLQVALTAYGMGGMGGAGGGAGGPSMGSFAGGAGGAGAMDFYNPNYNYGGGGGGMGIGQQILSGLGRGGGGGGGGFGGGGGVSSGGGSGFYSKPPVVGPLSAAGIGGSGAMAGTNLFSAPTGSDILPGVTGYDAFSSPGGGSYYGYTPGIDYGSMLAENYNFPQQSGMYG